MRQELKVLFTYGGFPESPFSVNGRLEPLFGCLEAETEIKQY